MLKADAGIASKPIEDVLKAMQRLAVIPVATGVLRSELMIMRQDRDEQFRSFAARVHGKTDTCSFSATCSCGLKVDYTDHMICGTLVSGISDDEIRRDVMGIDSILTKSINDIIALVESKEMARNAVPHTRHLYPVSGLKLQHATAKPLQAVRTAHQLLHRPMSRKNLAVHNVTSYLAYTSKAPEVGTLNRILCV